MRAEGGNMQIHTLTESYPQTRKTRALIPLRGESWDPRTIRAKVVGAKSPTHLALVTGYRIGQRRECSVRVEVVGARDQYDACELAEWAAGNDGLFGRRGTIGWPV